MTVDYLNISWPGTDDWDPALIGEDFALPAGTLEFPPGSTEEFIEVTILGDHDIESNEAFVLGTTNWVNSQPGGFWGLAFGGIQDDGDSGLSAPGTPGNVTATSGHNGSVPLVWNPPTDLGGATEVTYDLKRTDTEETRSATTNSFTWTGITNGATYTFIVRACNEAGCSDWTDPSNSARPYTVPSTVNKPSVTSQNNAIYVCWNAPNTGGDSITKYEVNYSGTTANNGTSTCRTINFGQSGTQRTFRVRACNDAGCGTWSSYSNSIRPKVIIVSHGADGWYDVQIYGPAGWSSQLRCNDGIDQGFWVQNFTTDTSGYYRDSQTCYSFDPGPYYVTVGSLRSNNG